MLAAIREQRVGRCGYGVLPVGRRGKRCVATRRFASGAEELETLPAQDPEPEAALFAQADREELIDALERVTPMYREVLLLRYSYDFSYQDIASVQQIPLGTVRSRLNAAKRAVRALLATEREVGE